MFKIIEGDFKNQEYGTENYLTNWPMLYMNITVRRSRQSGVARATCPD